MGNAQRRRTQFLEQHPICCYCGGITKATTQDHFPPRGLFRSRKWPEGYVFPACQKCNNATADDEQLMGLLCRIYPDDGTEQGSEEVQRQMRAISERHPEVFRSMLPSSNQVRRFLRTRGIELPEGATTADVPIVSLGHERFGLAARRFATKLFCSLFYRHTGNILRPEGGVFFQWFTNAHGLDKLKPAEPLKPFLQGIPTLKSQATSLSDQFYYQYGVTDTREAALFHVLFRHSLAMTGFVHSDIRNLRLPANAIVLAPFVPPV